MPDLFEGEVRPIGVAVEVGQLHVVVGDLRLDALSEGKVLFGRLPGGPLQLTSPEKVGGDPARDTTHAADARVQASHEVMRLRVIGCQLEDGLQLTVEVGSHVDLRASALDIRPATEHDRESESAPHVRLVVYDSLPGVPLGVDQESLGQILLHLVVRRLDQDPNGVRNSLDHPRWRCGCGRSLLRVPRMDRNGGRQQERHHSKNAHQMQRTSPSELESGFAQCRRAT